MKQKDKEVKTQIPQVPKGIEIREQGETSNLERLENYICTLEEIKEISYSNEISKITLPLKCNKENEITSIRINCKVVKGKTKIPVEGFVNTGYTMLIIKRELVPKELIVLAKEPMNAR